MTEIPPSRYKVVERGRRLEVIDTLTGQPAAPGPVVPSTEGSALSRPSQLHLGGDGTLTTRRFYDDNGPRTLTLDTGAAATLSKLRLSAMGIAMALVIFAIAYPWLLLLPFALIDPRIRKGLRKAATTWLDRFDPRQAAKP